VSGRDNFNLSLKPRLKSGVSFSFIRNPNHPTVIYVGNGVCGVTLSEQMFHTKEKSLSAFLPQIFDILSSLNGHTSLATIAERNSCSHEFVVELISTLHQFQLIDFQYTTLKINNRFIDYFSMHHTSLEDHTDGAYQSLLARIKPELELTTWYGGSIDGGVSQVHQRMDFPVLIVGLGRIAVNTAAVLQASGFQNIRVEARTSEENADQLIAFRDISGGYIRPSDCGVGKRRLVEEMNAQISLFPIAKDYSTNRSHSTVNQNFKPRLIISIGWPTAEKLQEWMSRDIPFLIVDEFINRTFSIGPLVNPGKSACLHCIHLTREDRDQVLNHILELRRLLPQREVPASLSSFIAGLISLDVISFADLGESNFLNSQKIYSLDSLHSPQNFHWGLHPECRCHAV
jgi:hypothetical protein